MELVILQDIQATYSAGWARVANTAGLKEVCQGDRFREQGFGPGSEELEAQVVEISPVAGVSRIYFLRCANSTQPAIHRLGAILEQVGISQLTAEIVSEPLTAGNFNSGGSFSYSPPNTAPTVVTFTPEQVTHTVTSATETVPLRKRGRPIGSRNRAKIKAEAIAPGFD